MNRRELLSAFTFLAAPRIDKPETLNSCGAPVNLLVLQSMLAKTIHFEMHSAQWAVMNCYLEMEKEKNQNLSSLFPISVNPAVPKDEIWLVAADGTIMSKIIGLAIPTQFTHA